MVFNENIKESGENHRLAAGQWQALYYVISSTPRLSGIWSRDVCGNRIMTTTAPFENAFEKNQEWFVFLCTMFTDNFDTVPICTKDKIKLTLNQRIYTVFFLI
jgi:hypothetical protein